MRVSTDLGKVLKDGFRIEEPHGYETYPDFAMLSLRASLRAYVETYAAIHRHLSNVERDVPDFGPKYTERYFETYMRSIIHAHHFVELAMKHILRDHDLLQAKNVPRKRLAIRTSLDRLCKLVKAGAHHFVELLVRHILRKHAPQEGFRASFDRLCKLVKAGELTSQEAKLVFDNKKTLRKLNELRNSIWHGGTWVLHYNALDTLFGCCLIDVLTSLATTAYAKFPERAWKYEPLACTIDPLVEILEEYRKNPSSPSAQKVALMKEMARAAYEVPASIWFIRGVPARDTAARRKVLSVNTGVRVKQEHEEKAKALAFSTTEEQSASDIVGCPVCGVEALLRYDVIVDLENGTTVCYTSEAKCTCCTFSITSDSGDPAAHGFHIPPILEANEVKRWSFRARACGPSAAPS
jgi:hypothetical protein